VHSQPLASRATLKTVIEYGANRNIFWEGDPADSVFFLRQGKVKLTVTSQQGKEAIIAPNSGESGHSQSLLYLNKCWA
jgi:CRP-like cAMP-binding protein